jgi:membrane dipeptidase
MVVFTMTKPAIFDAHLDLACLAENGRDMSRGLGDCGGPADPAVTFPTLREGRVRACLVTVFVEPDGDDAVRYAAGDAESAHAAGLRQIEWYRRWCDEGFMSFGLPAGRMRASDDGASWKQTGDIGVALQAGILVEGADPIRSPDELAWWVERGVVAVGLSWARPSRYSGGNSTPEAGLTDLGRAMIDAIDSAGVVHDLSHLSDRAMDELLSRASGRVIASHSNCRALMDGENQRHLRDESIREIARRGGVIGINLFGKFLVPPRNASDGAGAAFFASVPAARTSTIADVVAHVERICELVGHRRAVGLGTDMDGGFGASSLPEKIRTPRDLKKILDALAARGWTASDLRGFAWGNWARFWGME